MENKKVILVNDYYPLIKGGAEYQTAMLASLFNQNGFQVIFISLGFDKDEKIIDDKGSVIYGLKTPKSIFHSISLYTFFVKKMVAIIEKEKPILVYQRVLNSFSSYIANTCAKHEIPYCLHIADNYSLNFEGNWRAKIRKYLFKKLLKFKVHWICQTSFQVDQLKEWNKEATILPNLLPIESKTKNILQGHSNRILWVANIRPVKQLSAFLKLAKFFQNNQDFEFVVIGRKDNISHQEEVMLSSLKNVIYKGELSEGEVLEEMVNSAALVNTSLSEGFSNTFIQAWSRGLPIFSLHTNPNNWLESYKVGLVVNGDLNKMKEEIIHIFANQDLYKELVHNAFQLFEKQFNYQINQKKILSYFKDIVKNG